MIIIPAIDIKDGVPVRLIKGDYDTAHKVADSVLDTAISFKEAGAEYLHIVDLDAAKIPFGEKYVSKNRNIIIEVASKTGLLVQVGGGIRTLDDVEYYLSNNINKVILGTVAVKNPDIIKYAISDYGARIIVGIDAKDNMVRTTGWIEDSSQNYIDFAIYCAKLGVKYFVFTDINKDGTLCGVNVDATRELANKVALYGAKVIASGGIAGIDCIKKLHERNIYAAICGKALYNGNLDLKEAICEAEKAPIVPKKK